MSEIKEKLEKLTEDIWDIMAILETHNPNLFAIYTRLSDIIKLFEEET